MSTHNPASNNLQVKQPGAPEGILSSQARSGTYCYIGVRCKACSQEGRTTWLLLKYLGPNEGKKEYKLVLPPAPRMAKFHMYCEACDVNDSYSRTEAQIISLEKAPPPDFVNQY